MSRRVAANGVVCVDWQRCARHRVGANCDVYVDEKVLQFWIGDELMKTVARTGATPVRKKRASVQGGR